MNVSIIGAGVAGLCCASELVDRGISVTVIERSASLGESACSWFAGGMLAPYCESESAEPAVVELSTHSIDWWDRHVSSVCRNGSLVVSAARDQRELRRFARLTREHEQLDGAALGELEPALEGRFEQGLYFPTEAHLDPRGALAELVEHVRAQGGNVRFGEEVTATELLESSDTDLVIDCRGYSARVELNSLRGVKGEMLVLKSDDLALSRPVRLLHPRHPIYLVPRGDGVFMLGATMIENNERNRISTRSMLELLSSVYALHPGFGEAEILETGVDVRPAFPDNLPAVQRRGNIYYLNGLYRHGFLLGPAMAMRIADEITGEQMQSGEIARCG